MKNLKPSLEPLQTLNPLYQCFLIIKDQQQVLKDQLSLTTLPMKTVGTAIEFSARSQDSERTVLHPDLHVLTDDEHWTVTPETHKYAAAAGSICFVTTEGGKQQHI